MSRNAILSSAIFGVLLVLALLTQRQDVSQGVRAMSLDVAKILPLNEVVLEGKNELTLKREGTTWTVTGPQKSDPPVAKEGEAPPPPPPAKTIGPVLADTAAIERLTNAVTELEAGAFVTARKEKHADLQVDDATATMVTLKGAGGALTLAVGRSAQGGGFFMRAKGSDEVFIGKGALAGAIGRDADGFRERSLVPGLKADAIKALVIRPQENPEYTVEKATANGTTQWNFGAGTTLPANFRVDHDALGRLAQAFAGLKASDFADDVAPTAAGIGTQGAVVATADDGSTVEVLFGSLDDKKRRYAQVKGAKQIYLVTAFARDGLLKPATAHRDLSLFDVDATAVTKARFTTGTNVVEVAKVDGAWVLNSPSTLPPDFEFDAAGVEGKLAGVVRLKASEVATAAAAPTPGTEILLFTTEDTPAATVVLGALPDGADQTAKAPVSTSLDSTVYRMASYQAKRYADALTLFKKVERPPMPPTGAGGIQGLENLPPEIRAQIEAQIRSGQFGK